MLPVCFGLMLALAEAVLATPRLAVTSVRGFPGATVQVPVTLRYGSNDPQNVVALQADVVVQSGSANSAAPSGGDALGNHELASSEPVGGTRRILVYSLANAVMTNGVVASIPFFVPQGSFQNVRLSLENVILSTADAIPVPTTTGAGGIAINPVFVRPDGDVDGFLTVTNAVGEPCYIVQATEDFQSWANVFTNTATGNLLQFCDLGAKAHPYRFYRALLCGSDGVPREVARLSKLPGGDIRVEFNSEASRSYIIQASTNLENWQNLTTIPGAGNKISFTDPAATNHPHRFYRIARQ